MASLSSAFKGFKNLIARHYGDDMGKMLIHTGVAAWIMSSIAQIFAITINDKISHEQKLFLIPQEFADACVNIASFYLVTTTFKSVAAKLVNQGKWIPKYIYNHLVKNNLASKIGKPAFNVLTDGKLTPELAEKFTEFADGIDVIATTTGSVISCNLITPILRNIYASDRQQTSIARLNDNKKAKGGYFKPSIVKCGSRNNCYNGELMV